MTRLLPVALLLPFAALAQSFPTKPIRVVVPFPPGGVDITARLLQPKMQEDLGQPIIVENRPGSGGMAGSAVVAKSPPDGYTLLMTTSGTLVNAPLLAKDVPFDPIRDFTPITVVFQAVSTLVVNAALPAKTVKELLDYAKANPGKLSFASPGVGTNQHIDGEIFRHAAGVNMLHVPYKGFGQSIQDLIAGHVQLGFVTFANIRPHLGAGKVRLLAVGDATRYPAIPDVPAIAETLPAFQRIPGWSGAFLGPAGLPKPVLARLHGAAVKAIHAPEVRAKLEAGGSRIMAITPEEFAQLLKSDLENAGRTLKTLGIKAED